MEKDKFRTPRAKYTEEDHRLLMEVLNTLESGKIGDVIKTKNPVWIKKHDCWNKVAAAFSRIKGTAFTKDQMRNLYNNNYKAGMKAHTDYNRKMNKFHADCAKTGSGKPTIKEPEMPEHLLENYEHFKGNYVGLPQPIGLSTKDGQRTGMRPIMPSSTVTSGSLRRLDESGAGGSTSFEENEEVIGHSDTLIIPDCTEEEEDENINDTITIINNETQEVEQVKAERRRNILKTGNASGNKKKKEATKKAPCGNAGDNFFNIMTRKQKKLAKLRAQNYKARIQSENERTAYYRYMRRRQMQADGVSEELIPAAINPELCHIDISNLSFEIIDQQSSGSETDSAFEI